MFARFAMSRSVSLSVVVLMGMALLASSALAEVSQRALDRAGAFLEKKEIGKDVLSFVHFAADYKGHAFLDRRRVVDEKGNVLPNEFALVYRFTWENDGETDVAFLCDAAGAITQVKVVRTNALFQQPFALADAAIKVLGDAIVKAMGDNVKEQDRANLQKLVDEADSRGLLVAYLRMGQILK